MCADVTQNVNVVEVKKPVSVINKQSLIVGKIDKAAHLLFKALNVVLNCFLCHHLAHICSARGVAYHCSTAADECNRLVASHLKSFHKAKSHKVTNVQTVGSRVKANVEYCLSAVYKLSYFLLVSYLSNKSSCNEFFIYSHFQQILSFSDDNSILLNQVKVKKQF